MICKCDPGFEGPACERRMCPKGDDPLTLQSGVNNGVQVDEEQKCLLVGSGISGEFTLSFTDWQGKEHETKPFGVTTVTALEIQEALQMLPNNIIPSVTVSLSGSGTAGLDIRVTFTAAENSGSQNLLLANHADRSAAGHQPKYAGLSGTITSFDCTREVQGTEESKVCAGRGVCDTELGVCNCFTGFYGHSCAMQTALQ